ncbi:MAG: hypothetical protein U9Q83_00080 [Bacteroidota bacterium]|nr:hypothetical protein [Bacteroidota bacterium]
MKKTLTLSVKEKRKVKRFNRKFARKIRKAERLANMNARKHYVMNFGGRLHIVTYQDLKRLIKVKYFKKGTKIETLIQRALYATSKQYQKN